MTLWELKKEITWKVSTRHSTTKAGHRRKSIDHRLRTFRIFHSQLLGLSKCVSSLSTTVIDKVTKASASHVSTHRADSMTKLAILACTAIALIDLNSTYTMPSRSLEFARSMDRFTPPYSIRAIKWTLWSHHRQRVEVEIATKTFVICRLRSSYKLT